MRLLAHVMCCRIERRALANQKSVKFTRSDQPVDGEKDRVSSVPPSSLSACLPAVFPVYSLTHE